MSTPQDNLDAFFTMHCGTLPAKRRDVLRAQFHLALAAAEARGYERAKAQAEAALRAKKDVALEFGHMPRASTLHDAMDAIRDMKDVKDVKP